MKLDTVTRELRLHPVFAKAPQEITVVLPLDLVDGATITYYGAVRVGDTIFLKVFTDEGHAE